MHFYHCNLFTNYSQSSHELEARTTSSVDPQFSGLRIELWDSNGGGNKGRLNF